MVANAFLSKEEEKPFITCKDCKTQECIKTGKICQSVEKLLKKVTVGRRNWQTITDPFLLERYNSDNLVLLRGKNKKGNEESLYISKGKRKKHCEWEE